MGMVGNFFLLDAEHVRSLLADPTSLHDVLDAAYDPDSDRFVDVDKAWHCLHYLLTGSVDGGEPLLGFIASG